MFKLVQKSINQAVAKFFVFDQAGDIVGSINVPPGQIDALLKQWMGPVDRPQARMSVPRLKPRPMSRQAILRGCL
jgi:hypothetical protein